MDIRGFSAVVIALAFTLCVGCTETFRPSDAEGGDVHFGEDLAGVDIPGVETSGVETSGVDTPPGVDIPETDTAEPPVNGSIFRIWLTAGASTASDGALRMTGGIRPSDGVPSGDGAFWLIPVFRAGPAADDS